MVKGEAVMIMLREAARSILGPRILQCQRVEVALELLQDALAYTLAEAFLLSLPE